MTQKITAHIVGNATPYTVPSFEKARATSPSAAAGTHALPTCTLRAIRALRIQVKAFSLGSPLEEIPLYVFPFELQRNALNPSMHLPPTQASLCHLRRGLPQSLGSHFQPQTGVFPGQHPDSPVVKVPTTQNV